MQRQCAWCLRLIDSQGERLSLLPVPKLYEASHGMCRICGIFWLEQAMRDTEKQLAVPVHVLAKETGYPC